MEMIPDQKGLFKSTISLSGNLLTRDVQEAFQSVDGPNLAVKNNGIIKDGGITNIYENIETNTVPDGSPDYTYITSTGAKILLYYDSTENMNRAKVYVQNKDDASPILTGYTDAIFMNRRIIPRSYSDVIVSSDGLHLLGVWINGPTSITLDEMLISDFSITQSYSFTTAGVINAILPKAGAGSANTVTFATIRSTIGIVYCTNSAVKYLVNASEHNLGIAIEADLYSADNLSAVWNAGRLIAAVPYVTALSSPGLYYNNTPGTYTAWSNYIYSSTQGVVISIAHGVPGTVRAYVATYSKTKPAFNISIWGAGSITPNTGFQDRYSGTDEASFTMEDGITTPWGCSGIYSTSGSHPYGVFSMNNIKENNPSTTMPVQIGELPCHGGTNVEYIKVNGIAYHGLSVNSYKGNISGITIGEQYTVAPSFPVFINDVGGTNYDSDIRAGNIYNAVSYNGCFLGPSFDNEASTGDVNGASIIYQTNGGEFIYVRMANVRANPDFVNLQEISRGVVLFNNCHGANRIINTLNYKLYHDYSATGLPFLLNYTDSSSLCYIRIDNEYTSSLDWGLIYADADITKIKQLDSYDDLYNHIIPHFNLWDGQTGAYICTMVNKPTVGVIENILPNIGSYVTSLIIPHGGDVQYSGGAIKMPLGNALQIPGKCGFYFENLLGSQYSDFFVLKGGFYTYDGLYIYSLPLSNGIGSTLSGVPQPLVTAQGLKFLDVSTDTAFFLDRFDNSIWGYSGARQIEKQLSFATRPAITNGWYNDYDNTLYLQNSEGIFAFRDGSQITQNELPFASGDWETYSTDFGLYYVQDTTDMVRGYLGNGTIIPLNYQTGYLGWGKNVLFTVNKIVGRLYCESALSSTLNIIWHWVTQDDSGADTSSIATSPLSSSGYFTFAYEPPHSNVILFSVEIVDMSGNQKIVLLDLEAYMTYYGEAVISNKIN